MTLNEFIDKFDKQDTIILLEGKRNVVEEDKPKLIELGRLLAATTTKMLFRSGNANGSDAYFSEGVTAVDHKRLQVITPYDGHRKKDNKAYETISLDKINLVSEPNVIEYSKRNKKTKNLIDKYLDGSRNRYTIKASYIIRDTIKAIGTKNIPPTTFGIFYDDLNEPMTGGTGHTMNICKLNNIPYINQEQWFQWL